MQTSRHWPTLSYLASVKKEIRYANVQSSRSRGRVGRRIVRAGPSGPADRAVHRAVLPGQQPTQQALPSAVGAIQVVAGSFTSPSFTYNGPLALTQTTNPPLINAFFASAGGTTSIVLPTTTMSTGGFKNETLIKFTFTTVGTISGSITHDDGISLFKAGDTTTNLLPGASAPTSAVATPFAGLAQGTYDLYYTEANGAAAELNFNVTNGNATVIPEPVSMALLGGGLGQGVTRAAKLPGNSELEVTCLTQVLKIFAEKPVLAVISGGPGTEAGQEIVAQYGEMGATQA